MSQTEVRTIEGIEIPEPGDWQLDPVHTTVEFIARHLMVSKVRGKFTGVEGNIHISDDPLGSWVEVRIDPASVESGDAKRDEHLRSPDFLDVERFPDITFRSTRLEGSSPGHFSLAGDSELEAAAGAAREDRRAEEEEYAHAAARQWARHRDLLDITRELQHRGDTVAMQVGESLFRGVIDAVGADYLQLRTPAGRVDIALVVSHERTPVPLVIRVVERAREGGRRAEPLARTFRARLLEYDGEEIDAVIGSPFLREALRGRLTIGRDHVAVHDADGSDTYLPLDHVAWAHPFRE
jgi:hypothetical protein